MRHKIVIGNWKMNYGPQKAKTHIRALMKLLPKPKIEVVVCPPSISIPAAQEVLAGHKIKLGAQNMHFMESGAYTGEVSAAMLQENGVSHVLIGHSERRLLFHETNTEVNKKLKNALDYRFTPVLCIGETAEEREGHMTEKVLEYQLTEGLKGFTKSQVLSMIIAYEPVWAISGGDPNHKPATALDAQESHKFIRGFLSKLYDNELAEKIRIIYGGSAKPENIDELMAQPDIDGALPGAASLDPRKFARIVEFQR